MINECYACGCTRKTERAGKVRDDDSATIWECDNCGFVFLDGLTPPDEEYYANSGMHGGQPTEISKWLRETKKDDERRFNQLSNQITNKAVLDFGCGAGGFLTLAKQKAEIAEGVELEKRLRPHFDQQGLSVYEDVNNIERYYDIITSFHVLEHVEDPVGILRSLAAILENDGKLLLEVPSASDALLTLYGSKGFSRFTYWSCHLYLFSEQAIRFVAAKAGLKVDYIKQYQRYPLSNHLFWLAKGLPGGHETWSFIDDDELNHAYSNALSRLGVADTLIFQLSKADA